MSGVQYARNELADLLDSLTGWSVYDTVTENPDPPCIVIGLPVFDYTKSMGALIAISMPITLHYSLADMAVAQMALIEQLSPGNGGVIDLLQANRSGSHYRSLTCAGSEPFVTTSANTLAVDLLLEVHIKPGANGS